MLVEGMGWDGMGKGWGGCDLTAVMKTCLLVLMLEMYVSIDVDVASRHLIHAYVYAPQAFITSCNLSTLSKVVSESTSRHQGHQCSLQNHQLHPQLPPFDSLTSMQDV